MIPCALLITCNLYNLFVCSKQHASGKKFQEVLAEAIVQPLDIEGELYIGIPPGMYLVIFYQPTIKPALSQGLNVFA